MNGMENNFPFVRIFQFLWQGKMINTNGILAVEILDHYVLQ